MALNGVHDVNDINGTHAQRSLDITALGLNFSTTMGGIDCSLCRFRQASPTAPLKMQIPKVQKGQSYAAAERLTTSAEPAARLHAFLMDQERYCRATGQVLPPLGSSRRLAFESIWRGEERRSKGFDATIEERSNLRACSQLQE